MLRCDEDLHGFEDEMEDLESREKFNDEGIRRRDGEVRIELAEERIKFLHSDSEN